MEDLASRPTLHLSISSVHNVFHVPTLREYIQDEFHVIDHGIIEENVAATFVETSVHVLEKTTKKLRRKEVNLVKILYVESS